MKSFLRILWGVALTASIAFLAWERFKPTPVVISPDPAILSNYVQGKQWMRHARSTPYYLKREVGKEALGQPQTPTYQGQPASFTTLSITGATPTPLNGISLTGGTELTFFAAGTPSWGISGGSGGELYSIGGARPIGDSGTRVGNIFSQGAYNQSGSSVNTFSGHSDFTGVNAGNYAIGLNSGTTGICFNGSGVSGCTLGIQSASGTGALTFTTTGGSANFSTDIDLPDLGKFQWSATNYMQFNSNMFAIISNGGQIFTGERGLTANIYPGTGLTTTQLGGLISCNTTGVGNTGTTGPDDLQVYNLPASTLTSTNRYLRIVAKGTQANNTNAKQIRLAIGSGPTTIITKALQQTAVGTGDTWKIEARIYRTGSSAQDFDAEGYNYGGTTVALTDGPTVLLEDVIGTLTFTETSAQDIKTIAPQATATTTDDVKSELLCVYYE